jgi:hypothetical protein
MKRSTALRYCSEIHQRLIEVGGIVPTPRGEWSNVRVRNIWVFGSTAKGSIEPNDLDLLIRLEECGRRQSWQQVGFDPAYLRRTGIRVARDPRKEALMWLSRGMKNGSRHDFESELVEIDIKLPLWPVFDPKLKA